MQEEVNQRTVALVVRTGKLTADALRVYITLLIQEVHLRLMEQIQSKEIKSVRCH